MGIALTFGLIVLAMIYSLGDISGAHINPAVTIGFWAARRFESRQVLPYVVSQCAGAFLASTVLRLLFPANITLGATIPTGPLLQSFVLELILTALLMFVILGVSTGAREKGITAGIVVGSVIGLEAMFAGPICGASMNPARSLGPGRCQPPSAKPLDLSAGTNHWRTRWEFSPAAASGNAAAAEQSSSRLSCDLYTFSRVQGSPAYFQKF